MSDDNIRFIQEQRINMHIGSKQGIQFYDEYGRLLREIPPNKEQYMRIAHRIMSAALEM